MRIQQFVLSSSSAVLQSYLNLNPQGAFNGQGSGPAAGITNAGAFNGEWDQGANIGLSNIGAFNGIFDSGTSNGNDNIGAFNGSFDSGSDNGNGNIGSFNGNFNGNASLPGDGTVASYSVFGDGPVDVTSGVGKKQVVHGTDGSGGLTFNAAIGDYDGLAGNARGGSDHLYGGNNAKTGVVINAVLGDATSIADHAAGGNDTLNGGKNTGAGGVENALVGDALQLLGYSTGGLDKLFGRSNYGFGFVQNAECAILLPERPRQDLVALILSAGVGLYWQEGDRFEKL